MMYIARVSSPKNGKALYQTAPYPTREEAAAVAYRARPRAKGCSTSRAYWDTKLVWWLDAHSDIRWHNRGGEG
jgi:hypothetical protein